MEQIIASLGAEISDIERCLIQATSPMERPLVRLDDVSLSYGSMLVLDKTSVSIRSGEFVAVVGPSGCGKSSLMRLVTGLVAPSEGTVEFDGRRVCGPIKGAGMAFQNSTLLPWRTTAENVMLPLEIVEPYKTTSRRRGARAKLLQRVHALLSTVGLRDFADHFPWQLSGGMQQRANVCRALVHEPSLMLLDEPFAALDAFTKEDLWSVLQTLWLQQKFTAILVTHDLREAAFLADTVYVMSARPGRILHRCTIDLPRPRTEATTFDPVYTEIVNDLRLKVAAGRKM